MTSLAWKICKNKPVSLEVFADDYKNMKDQALKINEWGKNVYVKIPVTNSKGIFKGKIIKEEGFYWLIDSETDGAILEIENNTLIWHEGIYMVGDSHVQCLNLGAAHELSSIPNKGIDWAMSEDLLQSKLKLKSYDDL